LINSRVQKKTNKTKIAQCDEMTSKKRR